MKILCTDHYLLWMRWVRAKKNKPKIKKLMDEHVKNCDICKEKIKQIERK